VTLPYTIHGNVLWQLAFQQILRTMQFADSFETKGDCTVLIEDSCMRRKNVTGTDCRIIGTLPSNRH